MNKPASDSGAQESSFLAGTSVSLDYTALRHGSHCPLGIYVIPSSNNLFVWDAVFFVHQGYYADAILKFRLIFPNNYPESPPSVFFLTDVFHPLVSSTGVFNLAPRFRPWRPREHHAHAVLHWIKASFKKHTLDSLMEADCFNKEAYGLYHNSTQSFAALATQTASLSSSASTLFDLHNFSPTGLNASEIIFKKLDKETLELERAKLGLQEWERENAMEIEWIA